MVGCTPGIPKKVLLRFRDLEKAQLLLAFSDHTLPAQAAVKVRATRPPAASSLLPSVASCKTYSSLPASMPANPGMTPDFHAMAYREVQELAAQLKEAEIAYAAWESDMRAKLSQLDQDRQREDQLLYKLELMLAPSHLMYIAAKGLQLCLAGKQAGPYRQFAQQLSSRKHNPLNALGRELKQAGLLEKQVSLRQLAAKLDAISGAWHAYLDMPADLEAQMTATARLLGNNSTVVNQHRDHAMVILGWQFFRSLYM